MEPRSSVKRAVVGLVHLLVLPLGLWFTKKEEFRSDVLVRIGPPVAPPAVPTVAVWTEAIERALLDVTLNADDWEDHEVVAAVEALYGARIPEQGATDPPLARAFRNRHLLLTAREVLKRVEPGAVASIARRARAFDHLLRRIGLSSGALNDPLLANEVIASAFKALFFVLLGFPVAVLGVVAWWVPYRLCGVAANRVPGASEQRDQIALYKLLSGALLFPVTLAVWTTTAWVLGGAAWGALVLFALLFFEYASWRESQARELLALAFMPGGIARLRARRDDLVAECDRLAEVFRRTSDNRSA